MRHRSSHPPNLSSTSPMTNSSPTINKDDIAIQQHRHFQMKKEEMQNHCHYTYPIRCRPSTKRILLFNSIDAIDKYAIKIEEEGRDRNGASTNPSGTTHHRSIQRQRRRSFCGFETMDSS